MRHVGFDWSLSKQDEPKYTEKAVTVYQVGELQRLIAAASAEEALVIQFFLYTGLREGEVQYATWGDVDFNARTFNVQEKLDETLHFTPKDRDEGAIPIPDVLVELQRERRLKTRNLD